MNVKLYMSTCNYFSEYTESTKLISYRYLIDFVIVNYQKSITYLF